MTKWININTILASILITVIPAIVWLFSGEYFTKRIVNNYQTESEQKIHLIQGFINELKDSAKADLSFWSHQNALKTFVEQKGKYPEVDPNPPPRQTQPLQTSLA